jgi:hypothetical protein
MNGGFFSRISSLSLTLFRNSGRFLYFQDATLFSLFVIRVFPRCRGAACCAHFEP